MGTDNWTVTAVIGIVAAVAGFVIGYYKNRAEASDMRAKDSEQRTAELTLYVKKTDCIRCADQRSEIQKSVDARIDEGTKMFEALKIGQAVLLEKLESVEKQMQRFAP